MLLEMFCIDPVDEQKRLKAKEDSTKAKYDLIFYITKIVTCIYNYLTLYYLSCSID